MAREYTVKINVQSEAAAQKIEQFSARALANIEKINKVEIKPKTNTKDVEVSLNRVQEATVRAAMAETNRAAAAQRATATVSRAHATETAAIEKTKQKQLDLEKATVQANSKIEIQQMRMQQGQSAMNAFANATQNAVNQLKMLVGYAGATQMLRSALTEMKAMSDEMVTYQKVTGATAEQMKQVRADAYKSAKQYGQTPSDYLSSVAMMARAGYGQQSEAMANLATKTQLVGDMSAEMASKFLIAVDAGYQLQGNIQALEKVLNAANVADNNYATSLSQIAEGMTLVAPLAASMNVSVEETTAAIGTMQALTQRSGTEVARAFRMIAINIAKDTETEVEEGFKLTQENVGDFNSLLQEFAKDELKAADAAGKLLSPMKAIGALAKAWKSGALNEQQLFNVLNNIGGARYTNSIMALVKNFDVYEEMLGKFSTELTSADDEVAAMMDSWSAKLNVLKTSWTELVNNRVSEDFIKGLLDMGTGFLNWTGNLENFIFVAGGATKAISALGAGIKSALSGQGFGATNWLALGIGAVATALGAAKAAYENYKQGLQETSNKAAQEAKDAYDRNKRLQELVARYKELSADGTIDSTELEEVKTIQSEINSLVGDLPGKYDLVTGSIENSTRALEKMTEAQLASAKISAREAVNTSGKALVDYGSTLGVFTGLNAAFTTNRQNRGPAIDFLKSVLGQDSMFRFVGGGGGEDDAVVYTGKRTAEDILKGYDELSEIINKATEQGLKDTAENLYFALIEARDNMKKQVESYRSAVEYYDLLQKEDFNKDKSDASKSSTAGISSDATNIKKKTEAIDAYAESYNRLQNAIAKATLAQETFNEETKTTKADGMKFYGSALEALQGEMKAGRVNSTAFHAAAKALLGEEAYDKTGGYTQNIQDALFGKTGSSGMSLVDAITTLTAEYKNQAGEVRDGAGLAVLLEKLGYNVRDEKGNYAVHMTEQMYQEVMAAVPGLTREILENTANAFDQYDKLGRNTNWAPEKDKTQQKTPEQELTEATTKTGETMEAASQTVETAASTVDTAADKVVAAADGVAEALNGGGKKNGGGFFSSVQKAAVAAYEEKAKTDEEKAKTIASVWEAYKNRKNDPGYSAAQTAKGVDALHRDLDAEHDAYLAAKRSKRWAKQVSTESALSDKLKEKKSQKAKTPLEIAEEKRDSGQGLDMEYEIALKRAGEPTTPQTATSSRRQGYTDRDAAHDNALAERRAARKAARLAAEAAAEAAAFNPGAEHAETTANVDAHLDALTGKTTSKTTATSQNPEYTDISVEAARTEKLAEKAAEREERVKAKAESAEIAADASYGSALADKLLYKAAEKAASVDPGYQAAQTAKNVDAFLDALTGETASATTTTDTPSRAEQEEEEEYSFLGLYGASAANKSESNRQDAKAKAAQNAKAVDETARAASEINEKVQNLQTDVGAIQEDVHEGPTREELRDDFVKQLKSKGGSAFGGDTKSSALYQQGILAGDKKLQEKAIDMHIDNVISGIDTSSLSKDISADDLSLGMHAILDDYSVDAAVDALNYLSEDAKPVYIKVLLDHYSLSDVLANLDQATSQDRVAVIRAAIDKYGAQTVASEISKLSEGKKAMIFASLDPSTYAAVMAALDALATPITKKVNVEINERQLPKGLSLDDVYSNKTGTEFITPYATGTKYHTGGPAIVNDGTGAELIMDSSGAHIANGGREALIDLERGAKVFTAEQTRALLNGVPRFANGSEAGQRAQALYDAFDSITTGDTSYTKNNNNSGSGKSGSGNTSSDGSGGGGSGSSGGGSKEKDDSWNKIKTLIEYILTRLNKALEAQEELIDKQIQEINEQRQRAQQQDELGELEKRVSEARQNLADAENNRIVNYIDENGQWHWMADQKKVQQAKEELADAQKSLQDYLTDMVIDAQIKVLESEKTRLEEEYGGYTDLWSDILDAVETPVEGLEGLLEAVASGPDAALSAGAKAVRDNLIQSLLHGSYQRNYQEAAGEIANAALGQFDVPGKTDDMLAALIASSGTSLNGAPLSYLGALQSIAGSMPIAGTTLSENLTNNNGNTYIINGVTLGSEIEDMPLSQVLMALSVYTNTIY